MEAELILPDNTVIDATQPPPGFNFPKPDFTEIVQDHANEPSITDKSDLPLLKPTFKNILQAKKRLQAFSSTRAGSLPSSPKKVKANTGNEEKTEEIAAPVKRTPKRGTQEKAKSVIEQIEELKREEQAHLEMRLSGKRSRSRSRSADKGRFKKVEKKARNYRRGSIGSPEKTRRSPKKAKKYPKSWREFHDFDADFEMNRDFEVSAPTGNNDLLRHALLESPSLPIHPFRMKTVNREEKVVPFQYIRYTRTKPVVPYSVNFGAVKESYLSRKAVLESLPKDIVANIEKLYSNSIKFANDVDVKVKKSTMWYPKVWKDTENECKILEKSVGLSFLQNYTGEEEENDFMEEEIALDPKADLVTKSDMKDEKRKEMIGKETKEKLYDLDKDSFDIGEKLDREEEKKKKKREEMLDEESNPDKEEVLPKEDDKKRKKKVKQDEDDDDEKTEKKKKKHTNKEKKKYSEESSESVSKKKRRKKDKLKKKKDKREKEKKPKHKKPKEKKRKDKGQQEQADKPAERMSKQQVIEELREIEEKLARKREEVKEKAEKKIEKEDAGRKRKHPERENDAPKAKHDKHRRTSDEHCEIRVEHALKSKLEKAKKEAVHVKVEDNDSKRADKERVEKHEEGKKDDQSKRNENKKSRHCEEGTTVRKRKSRWSDGGCVKEELPTLTVVEEIRAEDSEVKTQPDDEFGLEDLKIIEEIKENTPDTDEYHSHWESDDDVSSSVPRNSLKLNRSWESDEELFERSHNRNKKPSENYASLEIPLNLNIKTFPRRSADWEEKPRSVIDELKLLEEERRSLSEERRKLELEKQKILKMQEEAKLDLLEEKKVPLIEIAPETVVVKVKKEKSDEFSLELNNSLSNVSSTESNFPIAALENEYEEFIKAVSSESSVSVSSKKKPERRSSSSSSSWSTDSDHKKKKRKAKMKKKKKKKKRECEGLLVGKGNDIFNEFDIPVPSDLPEIVPTPVPVPSPMLPLDTLLPITAPSLLLNSMVDLHEKATVEEPKPETGLDLIKPFVFSSIVLPSKKTPLVDNSNLKLDDDSDSADFTDKFVKKLEEEEENNKGEDIKLDSIEENIKVEEDKAIEAKVEEKVENKAEEEEECEKKKLPEPVESAPKPVEPVTKPVEPLDDVKNVPLPPEKAPPTDPPLSEFKPDTETKSKRSRSVSPHRRQSDRFREKRRSRSRSRERDAKRRSPIRRREPSPPPRRRYTSPRRRSPPRRRGSPWRRSPSPRRRSPPRRRRRSPSLTPPRSRGGPRKRTPSPRRRASPLNSPLDGFKRSVADSTISDDMLPQPNPDDYSESPPSYLGGAKYYDRKPPKRASLSPQNSPRRISLDDRINLVLGLEKNEPPPMPMPKPHEAYPNYSYNNAYVPQYPQYNQYVPPKNDYVSPFGPMMYTQPPPAIVKPPPPTPSKVVQVGNILQVVPTEEMPPVIIENKTPERSQKIVQVGNMLQIVPAVMPTTKPPAPEPPSPVVKPVQSPEKQSAEAVMKQKIAERKAEREKRRQERERRRKEKDRKRKEKEKRKQMKLKIKTENMIKRAIQIETEALANDLDEEEPEVSEQPVQWPPVPVIVGATPNCKGILSQGGAKQRKSVQFADGVRPGEGTSPSGGEELSSPPPHPRKLPKEKRYKKLKVPKKSKKKKVRVKVVKKVPVVEEDDDDDEDDNLPPPSPPPGSPPPHVFPSRVKTHTINNVHQYVGNIIQSPGPGYPFRAPMPPVMINRHQPPPGYMSGPYPQDVNSLSHQTY